jgi:hypothetical protein
MFEPRREYLAECQLCSIVDWDLRLEIDVHTPEEFGDEFLARLLDASQD